MSLKLELRCKLQVEEVEVKITEFVNELVVPRKCLVEVSFATTKVMTVS